MAHQNAALLSSLTAPGADNATRAGSTFTTLERRALYLKLFSGELFKGFQRNTIARDLVTKRTIKNGSLCSSFIQAAPQVSIILQVSPFSVTQTMLLQ